MHAIAEPVFEVSETRDSDKDLNKFRLQLLSEIATEDWAVTQEFPTIAVRWATHDSHAVEKMIEAHREVQALGRRGFALALPPSVAGDN